MTFKEFQESRVWMDKLEVEGYSEGFTPDEIPSGYCYANSFCIEKCSSSDKAWYLMLCNEEYESDDLELLEQKLYDFAVSECGL